MDEKTISALEKTIQFVAREIRRAKEIDQKNVLALAKLTSAFSGMLEKQPDPWDYEQNGDPYFHEQLEQEAREEGYGRRRRIIERHEDDD